MLLLLPLLLPVLVLLPPARPFFRPSVCPSGRLHSVSSVSVNHDNVSPFLLLSSGLSELLGGGEQLSHRLPCVAVWAARCGPSSVWLLQAAAVGWWRRGD